MKILAGIVIWFILAGIVLLFYGACKVSGDVDEVSEEYWKERLKDNGQTI